VAIITMTQDKDVAARFKSGDEMAQALRQCATQFESVDVTL